MTEDRDAVRRRRLRFRAWHRGMKEMDLILGTFADRNLAHMSGEELTVFEQLIEMPDGDLLSLITGDGEPPALAYSGLVERLRAVRFAPEDYH